MPCNLFNQINGLSKWATGKPSAITDNTEGNETLRLNRWRKQIAERIHFEYAAADSNGCRRQHANRKIDSGLDPNLDVAHLTKGLMTQPSFSESLAIQYPQLRELSRYYEELGLEEPIQWAYTEMTGEAAVATAALVHALSSEVCKADDHTWIELMQTSAMNVGNPSIAAQAGAALAALATQGVDLSCLTPLVRAVQAQVVRNIATLLDEGPEVCCIPLPSGREAVWEITGTATREGLASAAKRISGIYAIIDGSGQI